MATQPVTFFPLESTTGWNDEDNVFICRNFGVCFTLKSIYLTIPISIQPNNIFIIGPHPQGIGYKCIILIDKTTSYSSALLHGTTYDIYSSTDLDHIEYIEEESQQYPTQDTTTYQQQEKTEKKSLLSDRELDLTERFIKSFSQCSKQRSSKPNKKSKKQTKTSQQKHTRKLADKRHAIASRKTTNAKHINNQQLTPCKNKENFCNRCEKQYNVLHNDIWNIGRKHCDDCIRDIMYNDLWYDEYYNQYYKTINERYNTFYIVDNYDDDSDDDYDMYYLLNDDEYFEYRRNRDRAYLE